jgi:hypothetical protein
LWELPVYRVIAPPDAGLRARLQRCSSRYEPATGKITGMDYNLWYNCGMSGPEVLATLKHTLELRRAGNRAPFLLGMHSAIYADPAATDGASLADRRAAVVEFLHHALSFPEVRLVPYRAVLDWVRNPVPL